MHTHVVSDVLEVLGDALPYVYLMYCHTQTLHECYCIVVCTVGCSESGHCDSMNSLTVKLQFVECRNAHQQRKSGVKTAADAYDDIAAIGMYQPFCKSAYLY